MTSQAVVCLGGSCGDARPPTRESLADGWLRRDDLSVVRDDGLDVGEGWGLWTGVASMAAVGAALVVARSGRRHDAEP